MRLTSLSPPCKGDRLPGQLRGTRQKRTFAKMGNVRSSQSHSACSLQPVLPCGCSMSPKTVVVYERGVQGIDVRLLQARDVVRLEAGWERSVAGHDAGRWSFLTAWDGDRLVGSGCLRWEGPFNAEMAMTYPGLAELAFLQVDRGYRSAGLGTRLVGLAEAAAISRRERALGLAVGLGNLRARALYERLGYCPTGHLQRDRYHDERGVEVEEVSAYLVKTL